MPLYEVPVYVKVAAPSAREAVDYLARESRALESVRQQGLRDCRPDPGGELEYRSPNASETGVAGFVTGQPVRLASWSESHGVMADQIEEPE